MGLPSHQEPSVTTNEIDRATDFDQGRTSGASEANVPRSDGAGNRTSEANIPRSHGAGNLTSEQNVLPSQNLPKESAANAKNIPKNVVINEDNDPRKILLPVSIASSIDSLGSIPKPRIPKEPPKADPRGGSAAEPHASDPLRHCHCTGLHCSVVVMSSW